MLDATHIGGSKLKKRIGVLFGGKSGEHEVSIQSAQSIANALDKSKYDVVMIGIDKKGVWHVGHEAQQLICSTLALPLLNVQAPSIVPVSRHEGGALLRDAESGDVREAIDVIFPIAHGTFGEDGCLQGFLRLLDVPFAGPGVLGSAVGMDKDVMKRLFREAGIPTPKFLIFRDYEWERIQFEEVALQLGTPFFIKPCNLGSSVGISKVATKQEFKKAVDEAFCYDTKIIIEENVTGREIECAVLGNDSPEASVLGEIIVNANFYSYEAKYIDESGAGLAIPAPMDPAKSDEIRQLAVRVFQTLECSGMGRVDFFLKADGTVLVNEINTLPGFTQISMYPKLWEATGLPYARLLDRLIDLAEEQWKKQARLRRSI